MMKKMITFSAICAVVLIFISGYAISKVVADDSKPVIKATAQVKAKAQEILEDDTNDIYVKYAESPQVEKIQEVISPEEIKRLNDQMNAERKENITEEARKNNSTSNQSAQSGQSVASSDTGSGSTSASSAVNFFPSITSEYEDTKAVDNLNLHPKPTEVRRTAIPLSAADYKLMVCTVFTESGNQSFEGQLAVANVIFNRIQSSKFPDTLKGVVYAKGQFEVTQVLSGSVSPLDKYMKIFDEDPSYKGFETTKKAIAAALVGRNNMNGYFFFTSAPKKNLIQINYYKETVKIGAHYFYKIY